MSVYIRRTDCRVEFHEHPAGYRLSVLVFITQPESLRAPRGSTGIRCWYASAAGQMLFVSPAALKEWMAHPIPPRPSEPFCEAIQQSFLSNPLSSQLIIHRVSLLLSPLLLFLFTVVVCYCCCYYYGRYTKNSKRHPSTDGLLFEWKNSKTKVSLNHVGRVHAFGGPVCCVPLNPLLYALEPLGLLSDLRL